MPLVGKYIIQEIVIHWLRVFESIEVVASVEICRVISLRW